MGSHTFEGTFALIRSLRRCENLKQLQEVQEEEGESPQMTPRMSSKTSQENQWKRVMRGDDDGSLSHSNGLKQHSNLSLSFSLSFSHSLFFFSFFFFSFSCSSC